MQAMPTQQDAADGIQNPTKTPSVSNDTTSQPDNNGEDRELNDVSLPDKSESIYIVTEIWLPIPYQWFEDPDSFPRYSAFFRRTADTSGAGDGAEPDDDDDLNFPDPVCAGINVLAAFQTEEEADTYAKRHVDQLERLTKAPREGNDKDEYWMFCHDPSETDPFSGRYQETVGPRVRENGQKEGTVKWANRTSIVTVDQRLLHEKGNGVDLPKPLYTQTVSSKDIFGKESESDVQSGSSSQAS